MRLAPPCERRLRRGLRAEVRARLPVAMGCALALVAWPATGRAAPEEALAGLASRLTEAWNGLQLDAYVALRAPETPSSLEAERRAVAPFFDSDECRLDVHRTLPLGDGQTAVMDAHCFCVREPTASLTYLSFRVRRREGSWRIVERQQRGEVSGLVHLELGEGGSRADGRRLRFEDFELLMQRGFLFPTAEPGGPNALVFVGDGLVRFRPRPPAERRQLRLYSGREVLEERVHRAFIRVNPADLEQVLTPASLEPDPGAQRRLGRAQEVLERHAPTALVIDDGLPRAPWWTLSPVGTAVVDLETRRGTLTYTITSQPENVGLVDREKQLQIVLYPSADRPWEYSEDIANDVDVCHHDLRLRLDPSRDWVEAEDRLRLRLVGSRSAIRLRLDRALTVQSVTSASGAPQAHFRGAQNLLLVALDPSVRTDAEIALTVRYSGSLSPAVAPEAEPPLREAERMMEEQVALRLPKVYSGNPPWYPRSELVDYVTYRLVVDLPEDYQAVSGGARRSFGVEGGRARVEHVQDVPSRYVTLVVGRLHEAGIREGRAVFLRGFGTAETRADVPELLQRAAEIIEYFESLFGPTPYQTLNVVKTEGVTPGGHSPPGIVVLARRALVLRRALRRDPADFSDVPDFFLAHELAHQWWGHGVAPANYRERWLSEAFAHYAAALWVEHAAGEDAFRSLLGRMARWAIDESDQGPVGLGRRVGHVTGKPQAYRAVVYDKGALVAHMLRRLTGDAAFFAALRDLQSERRLTTANTGDLRRALERTSGYDLEPFLDYWIRGVEIPRLVWDRTTEGSRSRGYVTRLRLAPTGLPGPVWIEVTLSLAHGQRRSRVHVPPQGGTFSIPTALKPRRVTINEDWGVLARRHRDSGLID